MVKRKYEEMRSIVFKINGESMNGGAILVAVMGSQNFGQSLFIYLVLLLCNRALCLVPFEPGLFLAVLAAVESRTSFALHISGLPTFPASGLGVIKSLLS